MSSTVLSNAPEGRPRAAWRIGLTLPEHVLGEFEAVLEEGAAAVSILLLDGENEIIESPRRLWRLNAYCADAPHGAA